MNNNKEVLSPLRVVWGYVGFNMILVGLALLVTLFTIIAYPDEIRYANYFILPAIPSILLGLFLFIPIQNKIKVELEKKHDYLIVLLS